MRPAASLILAGAICWGCGLANQGPAGTVSCQPVGSSPAPIVFPVQMGVVTAEAAEERAVALVRACMAGAVLDDITSASASASGMRTGPNEGQSVWRVQVDARVTLPAPGGTYGAHWLIEVNQSTGIPTVIGLG